MKNKSKRRYKLSDEKMLLLAQIAHDNAVKKLPAFANHFPWLNAAYLAGFENDIKAAKSFGTDKRVTSQNKVTGNKNPIMQQACESMRALFNYACIAWPANKKKQNYMGKKRFELARKNIYKMITLLQLANERASQTLYKNDLHNVGCTQAFIDNLLTIATNLQSRQSQHATAKTERPIATTHRISLLNTVYSQLAVIRKCTRILMIKNG